MYGGNMMGALMNDSGNADLLKVAEKKVGITEYISKTQGIGGFLKEEPEFFTVYEIPSLPEIVEVKDNAENTKHLIIRVKKRNWDTINFARHLARRLGISQKRIGYAGTKDKKALTIQYYSIKNINRDKVEGISIKDSEIFVVGYTRRGLSLGDLLGNYFKIRVVDINQDDVSERINKIIDELKEKGIPNYFGTQRFGSIRYITHIVGLHILKRDYESAFWTYVAYPFEHENETARKVREDLWNSRDPRSGLKELPKYLRYERNLLQKLIEKGSEEKALLSLPKNLKMMFVHGYQSYIFNKLVSQRIKDFGSLKEVEKSDFVDFVKLSNFDFTEGKIRFYNPLGEPIIAGKHWKRINYLRKQNIAFLSLPLPGYDTEIPKECWASRLFELLAEDEVTLSNFKHEYPEFSSSGEFRIADMPANLDEFLYESDSSKSVVFEFFLPKGCYATSFLREFIK